jgi:hypothetical protein
MIPDAVARRRALRTARAVLEAFALQPGRPYDATVSLILDALHDAEDAMNDRLDAALRPENFNYASCARCEQPMSAVPLTAMVRPPGYGEPDPPVRFALCAPCRTALAQIEPPDGLEIEREEGEDAA